MKYKAAVFDMDGTILNTLQDLMDSTNYALSINNMPTRTYEEVRFFVGNGIRKLIERAVPKNASKQQIEKVFNDFNEHYKVHCADKTCAYNGILEAIKELKNAGIRTAVVSNKADYGVQELVEIYFKGLFDVAIGETEEVAKKPAPDMVLKALNELNVSQKDAVYIGDSDVDFQTAQNSNLDFIGVDWGFRGRVFLEKLGAKTIVDNAFELVEIICK